MEETGISASWEAFPVMKKMPTKSRAAEEHRKALSGNAVIFVT